MKNVLNVSTYRLQKGLVLEIVLVVLLAMLFATIGLYRSVDASTGVSGNLAFKRDAENRAQIAVDEVLTWVENNGNYQDFILAGVDDPANNFSARMLETEAKGIPVVLTDDLKAFDETYTKEPTAQMDDDRAQMRVRYLIERLCTRDGAVDPDYCSATEGISKSGGKQPGKGVKAFRPLLRVSIRVDGPRDTVAYAQAMIDP